MSYNNLLVEALWRFCQKYSYLLWAALLIFSLKFGADIRKIGYSVIPDPYIILDEHTNVWHGLSLRATGIPTAWSILSAYLTNSRETGAGGVIEGFNINVDGKRATLTQYADYPKPVIAVLEMDFGRGLSQTQIVQPYLDHPFFGALVLSLAVPKEVKTFAEVNNYDLRRMSLYLGILTQLLIFVLAYQITRKPWVGIMAGLIYATVPSYVLLSRYALLENVLSPLFLTNLILLIYARGKLANKKLFFLLLILAGFVGGLMALTKLAGWVLIAGSIILLYLWKFKFKQILAYAIPAILIGGLFFAWGLTLAPKLFLDLFLFQSVGRGFIGSINILVTAMRVSIFNFPVDGWWLGGFLALVFIPRKKECLPLGVGMIAVLASALVLVGANFPWYFIPLIPLMCIAVALFFANLATAPTAAGVMLAFFVFVSSTLYWGYGVFVKDQPFNLYRFAFLLFLAAAAVWAFAKRTRKYKKVWFGGIIVLMIVLTFLQRRGIYFILANWGKLPLVYTPGTF